MSDTMHSAAIAYIEAILKLQKKRRKEDLSNCYPKLRNSVRKKGEKMTNIYTSPPEKDPKFEAAKEKVWRAWLALSDYERKALIQYWEAEARKKSPGQMP